MVEVREALKYVQLILAGISIGVVIDGYPVADTLPKLATVYGTQVGFIMITIIVILSHLMQTPLHKNILFIISVVGCVLWLTAGSLIIERYRSLHISFAGIDFRPEDRLLVSAIFALLNASVYLLDAGLTFKSSPC